MAQRVCRVCEITSRPGKPGRYPISPATWWRWVKERKAPQPVKLGPNTTVWYVHELDAWDQALVGVAQ